MIKFFRKIRQNLLVENNTGKYLKYAIGEIVLVMIGILLALQVNEWNNERKRKQAEQIIITQLQTDLKKSQIELVDIKDFYLERTRISAQMLRAFYKEELPDNIEDYLNGANASRVYSPVLGTARSLINSGKIDIISSVALKNNIISYVEEVDYKLKDISRYEESYYRKGVDLVFQVMTNDRGHWTEEDFNKTKTENLRGFEENINEYETPIDKVPFASDLKDLFEDKRFYRGYSNLYVSHRNIRWRYDEILEITNELLGKLNKASTSSDKVVDNADHHLAFDTSDLKILEKTDALLSDSSKWNKNTNQECDVADNKYSLFCALNLASVETLGEYSSSRPSIKIVELKIKKYENRRVVRFGIIDWNDHPDTTFEELKQVLKEAIDEVKKQL